MTRSLVGRALEISRVLALLERARHGESGAVVVHGEAGVGKTALLEHAVAEAADMHVVEIAGVESEIRFGYAGLQRLLQALNTSSTPLPAPQQGALDAAFGLAEEGATDRFLVGMATLNRLAASAVRRPLLCVVDDAQWIDRESVDALVFVARRLLAERVVLIFGFRDTPGVDRQRLFLGIDAVALSGLLDEHARTLLARSTESPLDHELVTRIVAETNGNPLALLELVEDFTSNRISPAMLGVEPIPIGRRIEASFLRQVRDLPVVTQVLLLIASAEGQGDPETVRRALQQMTPNGATADMVAAADPAVTRNLLAIEPRVRFRHPLVRSAVHGSATVIEQQMVHRALAAAIDPRVDPEGRAWHRAGATFGHDETVANELVAAATRARSRGGHPTASAFLVRASQLTGEPHARGQWLVLAAEDALLAAAPLQAQAILDLAAPDLTDPRSKGTAAWVRGRSLQRISPRDAAPLLVDAATQLRTVDQRAARLALLDATDALFVVGGHEGPVHAGVADAAMSSYRDDVTLSAGVSDHLLKGFATRTALGYGPSVQHFRSAVEAFTPASSWADTLRWSFLGSAAAGALWDNTARTFILRRAVDVGRDRGALMSLWMSLVALSNCELRAGRFAVAAAHLAEARELTVAIGDEYAPTFIDVQLMAWQGRRDETQALADLMVLVAGATGAGSLRGIAMLSIALLELGSGRYEEAYAASKVVADEDSVAMGNQGVPELIEAACRTGRLVEARSALDQLAERAQAAGTPLARDLLARCSALLADGPDAETKHVEAIEILGHIDAATDLARAHLLFGEWLRFEDRFVEARVQMHIADDMFSVMGAAAFAGRARAALAATGERISRRAATPSSGLTSQETRIAELAARGIINSAIAAEVFVSVATVEYHLKKVFKKLGVTSRRQLAGALAKLEPSTYS